MGRVDPRLEAVDAAIQRMQEATDLTERECVALDAVLALRAMLHDVAMAGAAVQQERDTYSHMLRDFSEWSRQVQRLMGDAADALKRCAAPHAGPDFEGMRIAVQVRKALEAVKDPGDLDESAGLEDAVRRSPVLTLVAPSDEES